MTIEEGIIELAKGRSGHMLLVSEKDYYVGQERHKGKPFVIDGNSILYKENASNFVIFKDMLIYVYVSKTDGLAMQLQDKMCKYLQSKGVNITDAYDKRLDFVVDGKKMGAVIATTIYDKYVTVMMLNKVTTMRHQIEVWKHCNGFKNFNYKGIIGLDNIGIEGLYDDVSEFLEKDILI